MMTAANTAILRFNITLAICVLLCAEALSASRPFLSPVFGDNMVLQRDKPNTFWGWTSPGETVRVTIAGRSASAVAGVEGRWEVRIDPPEVGTECTVLVEGSQTVLLGNVIVGDVWLCGGQSNMQWGLRGAKGGEEEVPRADHPKIRLFKVAPRSSYGSVDVPEGEWKVCTPASVSEGGGFSAVAYFFAKKVHAETGVPIGLVQDCLGGSPAESWMSADALASVGGFEREIAEIERLHAAGATEHGSFLMNWLDEHDRGAAGATWADPSLDDGEWEPVSLASGFAALGLEDVPAVVWFRREFELPDPLPEGAAVLHLGVVEKMDTAYINGRWVGASSWVENPRAYRIENGVLKPGRNSIAIRAFKLKSKGSFLSDPETIRLSMPGTDDIRLAGEWRAKVSVDARPPHPLPLSYENYPTMPTVLQRGMLAPVAPLAIRGALWYQGEANASRAHQYRKLLPAMIADWRRMFGQGDFPFYIVSLPAFQERKDRPGTDDWAELREAQARTAASVPGAEIAITIDTGEADNIHPRDKKPVGERLALLALKGVHGLDVVANGPVFQSMKREGSGLRVSFANVEGGLITTGGPPGEFSIAGADREWHWAEARIEGDSIVVSSSEVSDPVAVRYAWQANPLANLTNGAGLPAAPFRSDDWPGVTEGRTN